MTDLVWTPVVVRLGDLAHWAENPVTLTKAQAKKLLKSTELLGRMETLAMCDSVWFHRHAIIKLQGQRRQCGLSDLAYRSSAKSRLM